MRKIKLAGVFAIATVSIVGATCAIGLAYNEYSYNNNMYTIEIIDKLGESTNVTSNDIAMEVTFGNALDVILPDQIALDLARFIHDNEWNIRYTVSYNYDKLIEIGDNCGWFSLERGGPIDAYIDTSGELRVVDEIPGDRVDKDKLTISLLDAIADFKTSLDLSQAGAYETSDVTVGSLESSFNNLLDLTDYTITYKFGDQKFEFNREFMLDYVSDNGDGTWSLDSSALDNFITDIENSVNSYGKSISFTTTDGRNIEVPGGNWGWKLSRNSTLENLQTLVNSEVDAIGELAWTNTNPIEGSNAFVNYVEIDMGKQHLYLYTNNQLVGDWDIVSGMANNPGRRTPGGVFRLTYKTKNAVLRGPTWESPVKYWMPFNGGIGMHDASWQPSFGGNAYYYRGSHGCINMPLAGAKAVYDVIDKTYAIICFY